MVAYLQCYLQTLLNVVNPIQINAPSLRQSNERRENQEMIKLAGHGYASAGRDLRTNLI